MPDIQRTYYSNGHPYQEVPFVEGKIDGIISELPASSAASPSERNFATNMLMKVRRSTSKGRPS